MKFFLGVFLGFLAFGLFIGSVGGIHDNIQFKDWFSVSMWAIFGPLGVSFIAASAGALISSMDGVPDYHPKGHSSISGFYRITHWAAIIWLFMVTVGLITGTAGGISDNIQFKDWFSVSMWAVCGSTGFILSGLTGLHLIKKLIHS